MAIISSLLPWNSRICHYCTCRVTIEFSQFLTAVLPYSPLRLPCRSLLCVLCVLVKCFVYESYSNFMKCWCSITGPWVTVYYARGSQSAKRTVWVGLFADWWFRLCRSVAFVSFKYWIVVLCHCVWRNSPFINCHMSTFEELDNFQTGGISRS